MNDSFDIYLDAVEQIIGWPYAEVVVAVVEECWREGVGVDVCAEQMMREASSAS